MSKMVHCSFMGDNRQPETNPEAIKKGLVKVWNLRTTNYAATKRNKEALCGLIWTKFQDFLLSD